MKVKSLRRVQPLVTPWTAAYQAPPSMGVSRQEYWSGPCSAKPLILLASIFPGEKVGGLASKSCLDPGDETAVLGGEPPGRAGTGWVNGQIFNSKF